MEFVQQQHLQQYLQQYWGSERPRFCSIWFDLDWRVGEYGRAFQKFIDRRNAYALRMFFLARQAGKGKERVARLCRHMPWWLSFLSVWRSSVYALGSMLSYDQAPGSPSRQTIRFHYQVESWSSAHGSVSKCSRSPMARNRKNGLLQSRRQSTIHTAEHSFWPMVCYPKGVCAGCHVRFCWYNVQLHKNWGIEKPH